MRNENPRGEVAGMTANPKLVQAYNCARMAESCIEEYIGSLSTVHDPCRMNGVRRLCRDMGPFGKVCIAISLLIAEDMNLRHPAGEPR